VTTDAAVLYVHSLLCSRWGDWPPCGSPSCGIMKDLRGRVIADSAGDSESPSEIVRSEIARSEIRSNAPVRASDSPRSRAMLNQWDLGRALVIASSGR